MWTFERFLVTIARLFPNGEGAGRASGRREFLGSALRVGMGLATLQFLGVARPDGLAASSAALSCSPEPGDGPCVGCYGCNCCGASAPLECEPVSGWCESGAPCWNDLEHLEQEFTCCDYCCPEEGFCCTYNSVE